MKNKGFTLVEPIEIMVSPDEKGTFVGEFVEPLTRGVYKLWAIAVDDRGAQSEPTSPKIVLIQTWWGARILSLLSVFIPLLALLFLLALLIMYTRILYKDLLYKDLLYKELLAGIFLLHHSFHVRVIFTYLIPLLFFAFICCRIKHTGCLEDAHY
jgi:hypothetical protein